MKTFTFRGRDDWETVVEFLNDTAAFFAADNENEVTLFGEKWVKMLKGALEGANIEYR